MFKAVLGTFLLEDNRLIFCLTDFFTMKIRLNYLKLQDVSTQR